MADYNNTESVYDREDEDDIAVEEMPQCGAENGEHACCCSSQQEQTNEDTSIIEVTFKGNRKGYFKNDVNFSLNIHDKIVVEADNGIDFGTITCIENAVRRLKACLKPRNINLKVLRKANDEDFDKFYANTFEEETIVKRAKELVIQFNLDMKITEAEWQFDRQRLTIYFTAPQRIDFRDLVKELARAFKTRIELRQISSREETKRIGDGIGCCGLSLCCTTFLNDFSHITLDHARTQQLSNNVAKLSGNCGRLKCCLLYEYDTYSEAFANYPAMHSKVDTKEGLAKIIKIDIFKNIITLHNHHLSKYFTISKEELDEYVKEGKIIAPDKADLDQYFGNGKNGIKIRKDVLGDEYIVE